MPMSEEMYLFSDCGGIVRFVPLQVHIIMFYLLWVQHCVPKRTYCVPVKY